MSSFRFSIRRKFSFWYDISFWYHVNWKRTPFRDENANRSLGRVAHAYRFQDGWVGRFCHHSRPQSPRSFWSAPRIETSGRDRSRKSANHGLPALVRSLRNLNNNGPITVIDWRKMSAQAPRKNHVVGFRECYWFSVRKCSREGKKNSRRLRVDRPVVFLPFWEIKACFMADFKWTLFDGKYYVGTPFSKSLPTCSRVKIDVLTWCLRQKGLRKRWVIFAFFDSDSPLPRGTKRYYKGTKEWFLSFV